MKKKSILPILFFTLLLDMIGVGMLIPIIPALFTDPSAATFVLNGYSVSAQYFVAGLITALFGLMQFIAAPILGELSDMYGRKRLLTLGVGTLAIAQGMFALGIIFQSLWLLFVSRAVAGIAGANFSIAQATIADVTLPENRARNFGLIGAAVGLGFVIGPFLGGTLTGLTGSPATPFLLVSLLGLLNVFFVSFFLTETNNHLIAKTKITLWRAVHNIKTAFTDKEARPLYFVGFFSNLGFAFYTAFIAIFLVARFSFTETSTGTYFAIVGFWIIFAQVVVVRSLSSRMSDQARLFIALPILFVAIGIYPLLNQVWMLYVLMPFLASAFALVSTAIPSLISRGVSPSKQGAALGINGSLQALSQALGPIMSGLVAGLLGITASFIIGSVCIAISLTILLFTNRPK